MCWFLMTSRSWLSWSHSLPNKENILSGSEFQNSGACFSPREMITPATTLMPEAGMHFLELPRLLIFLSFYLLFISISYVEGTGTWRSDCGGQHRVRLEGSHAVYRKESFQLQKVAWKDCTWLTCFLLKRGPTQPTYVGTWVSDRTTGLWAGTQTWDSAGEVTLWSLPPMSSMNPGGFSPVLDSTSITLIFKCHLFSAFTDVNIIMSGDHTSEEGDGKQMFLLNHEIRKRLKLFWKLERQTRVS